MKPEPYDQMMDDRAEKEAAMLENEADKAREREQAMAIEAQEEEDRKNMDYMRRL